MVLDPKQVRRVRELLATGQYSQRHISIDCGVSRGSVQRIQHGQRPDCDPPAEESEDLEEERVSPFDLPVAKCGQCGCRCTAPCVACAARTVGEKGRRGEGENEDEPADFGLKLAGDELIRYQAVHDAKQEPADD